MQNERITIKVQRLDPGLDREPKLEAYIVEKKERMTVLEALLSIRETHEPGLSFIHSCKYDNSCKLCLASIAGKVDYMCMVEAKDGIEVKPLPGRDILRDLVVKPKKDRAGKGKAS